MQIDAGFLSKIPDSLKNELLEEFYSVQNNFAVRRWENSGLSAGKFSEVVYTIIKGYISGSYPSKAEKPPRFNEACKNFENADKNLPRSIRIGIPRILTALYEFRNNRSIGHVGGDVNPNLMDSTVILSMTKWVIAELIRIFHSKSCEEATQQVESLSERIIPDVWEVDGKKRVLKNLKKREEILLLLHSSYLAVSDLQIAEWTRTRSDNLKIILRSMQDKKLIEYNTSTKLVSISPKGISLIEETLAAAKVN